MYCKVCPEVCYTGEVRVFLFLLKFYSRKMMVFKIVILCSIVGFSSGLECTFDTKCILINSEISDNDADLWYITNAETFKARGSPEGGSDNTPSNQDLDNNFLAHESGNIGNGGTLRITYPNTNSESSGKFKLQFKFWSVLEQDQDQITFSPLALECNGLSKSINQQTDAKDWQITNEIFLTKEEASNGCLVKLPRFDEQAFRDNVSSRFRNNKAIDSIVFNYEACAPIPTCTQPCQAGYEKDQYGCETCDCKELTCPRPCHSDAECKMVLGQSKCVCKNNKFGSGEAADGNNACRDCPERTSCLSGCTEVTDNSGCLKCSCGTQEITCTFDGTCQLLQYTFSDTSHWYIEDDVKPGNDIGQPTVGSDDDDTSDNPYLQFSSTVTDNVDDEKHWRIFLPDVYARGGGECTLRFKLWRVLPTPRGTDLSATILTDMVLKCPGKNITIIETGIYNDGWETTDDIHLTEHDAKKGCYISLPDYDAALVTNEGEIEKEHFAHIIGYNNLAIDSIHMLCTPCAPIPTCTQPCQAGYEKDQYGCETCDCKELTCPRPCHSDAECKMVLGQSKCVCKNNKFGSGEAADGNNACRDCPERTSCLSGCTEVTDNSGCLKCSCGTQEITCTFDGTCQLLQYTFSDTSHWYIEDDVKPGNDIGQPTVGSDDDDTSDNPYLQFSSTVTDNVDDEKHWRIFLPDVYARGGGECTLRFKLWRVLPTPRGTDLSATILTDMVLKCPGKNITIIETGIYNDGWETTDDIHLTEHDAKKGCYISLPDYDAALVTNEGEIEKEHFAHIIGYNNLAIDSIHMLCTPCAPIPTCTQPCQAGYEKDQYGCETCDCKEPTCPRPCHSDAECKMVLGQSKCVCENNEVGSGEASDGDDACRDPNKLCDPICHEYADCEYNQMYNKHKCVCREGKGSGLDEDGDDACPCVGFRCLIYCRYGYVKDGHGCETCQCMPACGDMCHEDAVCVQDKGAWKCQCKPGEHGDGLESSGDYACTRCITCSVYCKFGYEEGENGCPSCKCKPRPTPVPHEHCPDGYSRMKTSPYDCVKDGFWVNGEQIGPCTTSCFVGTAMYRYSHCEKQHKYSKDCDPKDEYFTDKCGENSCPETIVIRKPEYCIEIEENYRGYKLSMSYVQIDRTLFNRSLDLMHEWSEKRVHKMCKEADCDEGLLHDIAEKLQKGLDMIQQSLHEYEYVEDEMLKITECVIDMDYSDYMSVVLDMESLTSAYDELHRLLYFIHQTNDACKGKAFFFDRLTHIVEDKQKPKN